VQHADGRANHQGAGNAPTGLATRRRRVLNASATRRSPGRFFISPWTCPAVECTFALGTTSVTCFRGGSFHAADVGADAPEPRPRLRANDSLLPSAVRRDGDVLLLADGGPETAGRPPGPA